jgi:uncharacterized damage-inducible protein DinB
MNKSKFLISALLVVGLSLPSFGAHHKSSENLSLFQQVFLKSYSQETDKMVNLAEAFSDKGFEWRPAEGIRSVRETILHVASANYGLGSKLGKAMPEGVNPRSFEKSIMGKAETITVLKDSIQFAKAAVRGLNEESLAEVINLYGTDSPKMAAVQILGGHAYEHLGQLIAYARSSGVVPPWSK